jgi:N-acetyl-1-D-myo-inositol-2-amino-2-deoxy-alpha-D-glucopyranoside deacetylase
MRTVRTGRPRLHVTSRDTEASETSPQTQPASAIADRQPPTILATFAHPDDETFGSGGTFARYAAAGSRVVLVCTTRGEVGEISDPALATPETLGEVREEELRCAARALGMSEVIFLGYRDSGMIGTADNSHERAYVNAPPDEVIHQLVGIIRRERPAVIVTFDPTGGYGHPDHIAIHQQTVAALHAAADPAVAPDLGPAWQVSRLCYIAILRSALRQMRDALAELGEDVTMFDELEASDAGTADEDVTIQIDVSEHVDAKAAAFECHRTQFAGDGPFQRVPPEVMRRIMSVEHFTIGWPEHRIQPGEMLDDLLAGL